MSNKSPDTAGIKVAAKKKSDEMLTKVLDSLKIMENQSISINFNSVSNFTGVATGWLYKQPTVRDLIQQARGVTNNLLMRDQAVNWDLKIKKLIFLLNKTSI